MLLALVCGEEPDGNDDDDEGVEEPYLRGLPPLPYEKRFGEGVKL